MTWGTIAYLLAGQVVGGVGATLVVLALIGDRLKGNHKKRRCPKCWFDLSGTPPHAALTCPECGRTAAGERELLRSRRRWTWAAAGMVLMLASVVVSLWPSWRRGEWFSLLPPVLKLELWAYTDRPDEAFEMALKTIESDRLKARAMEKGLRKLVSGGAPTMLTRFGPPLPTYAVLSAPYSRWPLNEAAQASLKRLLTDSTLGHEMAAVAAVQYREDLPEELREVLYSVAADRQKPVRWRALEAMGVLGVEQAKARRVLVEQLRLPDASVLEREHIAGWLMRASRFHSAELLEAYTDGTQRVRDAIAGAVSGQVDDYAAAVLFPRMLDEHLIGEPGVVVAITVGLERAGPMLDPLLAAALDSASGAQLGRLVELIRARTVHNAIVCDAMRRCAAEESRPEEDRRLLADAAAWARGILNERVAAAAAQGDDTRAGDLKPATAPESGLVR